MGLQVVVVGGGLGGLCLAHGLRRAGVAVSVHERDADAGARAGEGYRIHVDEHGSAALHACLPPRLWQGFVATAAPAGAGVRFTTEQLRDLLVVDDPAMAGGVPPERGQHAVSRTVLRALLRSGLDDVVHYGRRCTGYTHTADGRVTAHFADGSEATGDVLVGADGAHSVVRAQRLPGGARVPTGGVALAGRVPLDDAARAWLPPALTTRLNIVLPPEHFLFTAVFDRRATRAAHPAEELRGLGLDPALLHGTDEDYVFWVFISATDAMPADLADRDRWDRVRDLTAGWHPHLRRLLASADPGGLMALELRTSRPVRPWATDRVTLLGDALHSMSPTGGNGGNTALRDARLLTAALSRADRGELPLHDAIAGYERELRRHGFAQVRASLRNTRQAIDPNPLRRRAARAWLRACGAFPPLARLTLGG